MPLQKEELQQLAALCRISLAGEEEEKMCAQLEQLCLLAQCLSEADCGELDALADAPAVTREDVARGQKDKELLLACAPERKDGFFFVSFEEKEGAK